MRASRRSDAKMEETVNLFSNPKKHPQWSSLRWLLFIDQLKPTKFGYNSQYSFLFSHSNHSGIGIAVRELLERFLNISQDKEDRINQLFEAKNGVSPFRQVRNSLCFGGLANRTGFIIMFNSLPCVYLILVKKQEEDAQDEDQDSIWKEGGERTWCIGR